MTRNRHTLLRGATTAFLAATLAVSILGPSAWACTAPLFAFPDNNANFGFLTVDARGNLSIPALATGYDGSNGNGPVTVEVTASGAIIIHSATNNAVFGNGQPFTFTLDATPTGTGPQSGNLTFSPFCGTFPGAPVTLAFTYDASDPSLATFYANVLSGGAGDPVSTASGELFGQDQAPDLELGGLSFRRYYASYLRAGGLTSALGTNWMHSFDVRLAAGSTTATITLFRGKKVAFTRSGNTWPLSSTERRPYQLADAGSGFVFLDPVSNLIYGFNASGALTRIEDRNGNTLTVTQAPGGAGPAQVTDGLGRSLTFTYTGTSLTRVQDSAGRSVSFEYSGGALSAWTDANGKRSTFSYTTAGALAALMTSETRPAGNQPLAQQFDPQGRVSRQSDSLGNAMNLAYSGVGATVMHPAGVTLTHAHDANRNLVSQSDPGGGASQYSYDANGRPTSVVDRSGARTTLTWDAASGLPAGFTDELGNTTQFRYAASVQGNFTFHDLSGVTFADGTSLALARDARGNVTSLTDPSGRIWQATWTPRGQIATFRNPAGGVTTFTYAADGTPASIRTDSGDTTAFGFDATGRLNRVTHPDGAMRSFEYDARGNPLRATDERNNSLTAAFNDNNNLRTAADALAAVTTLAYDTNDRVVSVTDALGKVTRQSWDSGSRVQSVTGPAGESVTYSYDTLNRVTGAVDATGRGFTYGWDREARLTSVTDALARTLRLTRDARGRVTGLTTPGSERFSFAFDALDRPTSSTDPLGRVAQFRYDPRGLLSGTTLPGGVTASFERNEAGLITGATDPNGNVWRRGFDTTGRMVSSSDPLGRATSYHYDSRRRLASSTLPQGSAQFLFDAAGNLTGMRFSDNTALNYTYDANGRLSGADGLTLGYDAAGRLSTSNGLAIARDDAGRIASVTHAAGKIVRYSYDNRGLLSEVADWIGGSTSFAYDAARQLTSITFPNGIRQDYAYDANGNLETIRVNRGGSTLSSITLRRDALGRVVSADRPEPAVPVVAHGDLDLAFDAAHQESGATYDALGRVTRDGARTYEWDLASHLTAYRGANGEVSFTYDGMGQRVSRTSGGGTQNYVLNYALPLPSVAVVRSGGADQRYYLWRPDGILLASIETTGARRFYHFDESGSAILLTDDAGAVTDTYAGTPYGEILSRAGSTDNPFTFQGAFGVMQEGATGLYYMRARYYDGASARFLSKDPVASLDPRALNPYQFVFGNPVEGIDPSGLEGFHPGFPGLRTCTDSSVPATARAEGLGELIAPLNGDVPR